MKDYKYRTPGFKALSLGINLSGGINDSKKSEDRSEKDFSLSPSQVAYVAVKSTDRQLSQSVFTLYPYGYFTSSTINKKENKYSSLQSYFNWQYDNRIYKPNQQFFEVGNELSNVIHGNKQNDTIQDYKSNSFEVQDRITLGIGKGRIEQVQDAQMALYILNDLEKQGLLSSKITPAITIAFAKLITAINNKRVFDSRKKRIYELTQIDSFLRSSGLAATTDIRHYTTINDNWSLAFNPYRLSGANWYVRIKPGIGYTQNGNTTKNFGTTSSGNYKHLFFLLSPVVGYERYVPVNLKWQLNMGTSLVFEGTKNIDHSTSNLNGLSSSTKYRYDGNLWLFNGFYGIGYFPNTRTQLVTTFNLDATLKTNDYLEVSPSLNFDVNYFISYRTYLRGNLGLSYKYANDQANLQRYFEGHEFKSSVSVSFSHILF